LNTFQPQSVCSFLHNGSTLYIGYAEMHRLRVATRVYCKRNRAHLDNCR
jgi:uncharacterized ParB-like nuclease family protein